MYSFHIPDMSCGGCLKAVTRAIQSLDPQARIEGNLEDRIVQIGSDRPEADLLAALRDADYPAEPVPAARD